MLQVSLPTQYNGRNQDPVGGLSSALARLQANRPLRELREVAKGITKQLPQPIQVRRSSNSLCTTVEHGVGDGGVGKRSCVPVGCLSCLHGARAAWVWQGGRVRLADAASHQQHPCAHHRGLTALVCVGRRNYGVVLSWLSFLDAVLVPPAPQVATSKIDEYARGMISGSGSTLFEELGLYYIGPVDGHNVDDLVAGQWGGTKGAGAMGGGCLGRHLEGCWVSRAVEGHLRQQGCLGRRVFRSCQTSSRGLLLPEDAVV